MTRSSLTVRHALKSALETLQAALGDSIGERKKRTDLFLASPISPDLRRCIQRFVDALYEVDGGHAELRRRATMIEILCGPTSDYEIGRVTAVLSYQCVTEVLSSSQMAMRRLQKTTSQPVFLSILDGQWDDLQLMLTDGKLDLVDSTRQAHQDWRDAIRKVQRQAAPLKVDGCWYLFYIHGGCEGKQSERTNNANAFALNNLEEIADAADYLAAWAGVDPHGDRANGTVVSTVKDREPAKREVEQAASGSADSNVLMPESVKTPKSPKPKRSTERGEGRVKLISALTKHHKYANGSSLNMEPIASNKLARLADVSKSTASEFFQKEFAGHVKYRAACKDASKLVAALKLLNQEFSPHLLFGDKPPGEGEHRQEE